VKPFSSDKRIASLLLIISTVILLSTGADGNICTTVLGAIHAFLCFFQSVV